MCPGPRGHTTQYQVTLQFMSFAVTAENVNISACRSEICSHTYNFLIAPSGSVLSSVSVAAENVVGVGPARTCTAQPISELTLSLTAISCNGEQHHVTSPVLIFSHF